MLLHSDRVVNRFEMGIPLSIPASNPVANALILAFSFPPRVGILALSTAGMIAFSRVYLAVHYPTDVIGGVLSAALVDFAVVSLF